MSDANENRARTGNPAGTIGTDAEIAPDTTKGNPVAMPRTAEAQARADVYNAANQKEVLPEHLARVTRYPLISAVT